MLWCADSERGDTAMKVMIKADAGKLYRVIRYETGSTVQIPINKDGSVKWFDDEVLKRKRA